MSNHIMKTVEDLEIKLSEQVAAVNTTKKLINQLLEMTGASPRYLDIDAEQKNGVSLSVRSDQFYGRPQATSVREILEMRKALNKGPATLNDIYSALIEGGYASDTKNEDNAKRGLRNSIMKNVALFHKLPNGMFGLLEWYPNAKNVKQKNSAVSGEEEQSTNDYDVSDLA